MKAVNDEKFRYLVLERKDCLSVLGYAYVEAESAYPHSDTSTKTWVRIATADAPSYANQPVTVYTYRDFMAESVQALFYIDFEYYLDNDLPIPGEPLV